MACDGRWNVLEMSWRIPGMYGRVYSVDIDLRVVDLVIQYTSEYREIELNAETDIRNMKRRQ